MDWKKIGSAALTNNFVLIAFIALAAFVYLRFAPDSLKPWTSAPTAPAAEAKQPKETRTIERIIIQGPERVQVIEKIKYLEKMPDVVQPATASNPAAQVIASAEIPPYNGKTIATAILESGTDNVARGRIETKQLPSPFFQMKKEFGVRIGYGTGGVLAGEIYARPVRVGPVDIEARGFVYNEPTRTNSGGMVLGDYRF